MEDRRRNESADTGARTRRTDRNDAAHTVHDWVTTFNLRWIEHLKRSDRRKTSAGA
jgi:hypothetical protein